MSLRGCNDTCPAQPPNLNLVEHLWEHIERYSWKKLPSITYRNLCGNVIWNFLPDTISSYVLSMPDRLKAVIKGVKLTAATLAASSLFLEEKKTVLIQH